MKLSGGLLVFCSRFFVLSLVNVKMKVGKYVIVVKITHWFKKLHSWFCCNIFKDINKKYSDNVLHNRYIQRSKIINRSIDCYSNCRRCASDGHHCMQQFSWPIRQKKLTNHVRHRTYYKLSSYIDSPLQTHYKTKLFLQ